MPKELPAVETGRTMQNCRPCLALWLCRGQQERGRSNWYEEHSATNCDTILAAGNFEDVDINRCRHTALIDVNLPGRVEQQKMILVLREPFNLLASKLRFVRTRDSSVAQSVPITNHVRVREVRIMLKSVKGVCREGRIELLEPVPPGSEGAVIVTFLETGTVDLRERAISEQQAADLSQRLAGFAKDWRLPEMDIYDAS